MNIEQAIAIFERVMRLRDPALLTPECCEIALEALREKAERENPKPLTLEELKERVGKPVYIMWRPDENWHFAESGWVVVELDGEFIDGYSFKNYGKTWLAYSHELKEAR